MTSVTSTRGRRDAVLRRLLPLARQALFGTLSETYRTCGRVGCHCQTGAKHGPHLYMSFRGSAGTTAGYYVPQALDPRVRAGVAAWQELQARLREAFDEDGVANPDKVLPAGSRCGDLQQVPAGAWI